MEFLVRIDVHLPPDMPSEQRDPLLTAERVRGRELIDAGFLTRIWRVPGRISNYSLYNVPDATMLHDLLSSLPLWRWTTIEVQALATHPLEMSGDR